MAFSIVTDDAQLIYKAIADLTERTPTVRIFVRRVGTKWKAIGCDIPDVDADLMIPITPEDQSAF
jgi:hypothetical protein